MWFKLLAVLVFASLAAPGHAQIDAPEAELVKAFGQPSAVQPKAKGDYWDKTLAFGVKKLGLDWAVVARLKNGKVCSIVYGHAESGKPMGETELMVFLSENANRLAWNKQVIRAANRISWFRNDNGAFAFYDGQDKRPNLHIMDKALWDVVAAKIKVQPGDKKR